MQVILYVSAFLVLLWRQCEGQQNGHYRCHWYPGPAQGPVAGAVGNQTLGKTSQCTQADSESLRSMVTQCTGQNFQHPAICQKNETWDCNTFFGVCKTLIRTESPPRSPAVDTRESIAETCKRLFATEAAGHSNTIPASDAHYPGSDRDCPKDANYFTLKDMSLAVLISFITGATMLAVVIFVVWKCRNTKWEMEQRKLALLQKVQSLAALQHIMSVTSGVGSRHDVESGHFQNPNYAQVIASNTLMEEIIGDQDKIYEEIMMGYRDSSLKKREENLYAKVEKRKKKDKNEVKGAGDVKQEDTDNDSVVEETEISNAISSVTDSGFQEEGYEDVEGNRSNSDRPVFTIDTDNETS